MMRFAGYHNPRRTFARTAYEKVFGEFGRDQKKTRAAYRQFILAGIGQDLASPFSRDFRGVLVGGKPSLETIREVVAAALGYSSAGGVGQANGRIDGRQLPLWEKRTRLGKEPY